MLTTARPQAASLPGLVPRLLQADGFAEIVGALQKGQSAAIDGAWGSSCALAAAALATKAPQTLLVVVPRIGDVDEFAADVAAFLGETPLIFPAWESRPQEYSLADAVFGGRLRILRALDEQTPPRVVVTSFPALLQPVPSRDERRRGTRTLRVGDEIDLDELLRWFVDRGFERVPAIELPGEFSLHGGILDLFPPDAEDPLRVELFGDEIESIRRFAVETQRKIEELDETELTLVSAPSPGANGLEAGVRGQESGVSKSKPAGRAPRDTTDNGRGTTDQSASLLDSLPPGSWIALTELQETIDEAKQYLSRLDIGVGVAGAESAKPQSERRGSSQSWGFEDSAPATLTPHGLFSVPATLARCTEFPTVTVAAIAADSMETTCRLQIESIERFAGPRAQVIEELASVVGRDERVLIACHNEGERERLTELLHEFGGVAGAESAKPQSEGDRRSQNWGFADSAPATRPLDGRVELCLGTIARGFRMTGERTIVLSDHELFGRTDIHRITRRRRRLETRAIDSFLELKEGDLVVHLTNGIGRFRGMQLLEKGEQVEEHLVLEFRDGVRVFVPASLIHLVQKYVGASKGAPVLSRLNSASWAKKKSRVAQAVRDMASDMIRLQAAREAKPGLVFPPDSHWQQEFEAAFPYTETEDQLESIVVVKEDMQRPRPMDRLICGDVGYGKTEVAMRAAFKAIDAAKQVAVLVPTTVLAEQHFRTFSERMAEYPVTIEVLSRFRTKAEQKRILDGMAAGTIDVVIGTHRLVQKDVRFKDLGLLVIDEEQRFGVEAKEMLKRMRLEVDVLTLSATPIPRTLHMSLLGIRDISNLTTAPQGRQSIETRISRFDGELIRSAIVRELNRGGQVYFVHNRVYNIRAIADRVQSIVPEARIGIAHGQMPEHELERAMFDFVAGKTDVLVCTTIIESGLDIPNANTIFIHMAGHYGLADLHQLRGRVGRYKHRAYCYLLLEEGRPVTPTAAKRLKAIEEFSELGAGFKIAMRDLEIRGAGNILGTEQSGHISAVGYELYCQLLENAVRRLRNEPIREHRHVAVDLPGKAYLSNSYIPAGRQKIDLYRKLSNVGSAGELRELESELRDRFGPIPPEAARLLELKELQLAARNWDVESVHLEGRFAVFGYRDPQRIQELKRRLGTRLRIVDARNAYLLLEPDDHDPAALPGRLKSVLQPNG